MVYDTINDTLHATLIFSFLDSCNILGVPSTFVTRYADNQGEFSVAGRKERKGREGRGRHNAGNVTKCSVFKSFWMVLVNQLANKSATCGKIVKRTHYMRHSRIVICRLCCPTRLHMLCK